MPTSLGLRDADPHRSERGANIEQLIATIRAVQSAVRPASQVTRPRSPDHDCDWSPDSVKLGAEIGGFCAQDGQGIAKIGHLTLDQATFAQRLQRRRRPNETLRGFDIPVPATLVLRRNGLMSSECRVSPRRPRLRRPASRAPRAVRRGSAPSRQPRSRGDRASRRWHRASGRSTRLPASCRRASGS